MVLVAGACSNCAATVLLHYLCLAVTLYLSHLNTISPHYLCLAAPFLSRYHTVSVYGAAAEGLLNPFKARLTAVVKAVLQRTAAGKGRRETCALVDLVRVGDHSTRLNADPLIARDMLVSPLSLLTAHSHRHPHSHYSPSLLLSPSHVQMWM